MNQPKINNLNEIAMNFPTNVFSNSSKYVQSVKSTKKLQVQINNNLNTVYESYSNPKQHKICEEIKQDM